MAKPWYLDAPKSRTGTLTNPFAKGETYVTHGMLYIMHMHAG